MIDLAYIELALAPFTLAGGAVTLGWLFIARRRSRHREWIGKQQKARREMLEGLRRSGGRVTLPS